MGLVVCEMDGTLLTSDDEIPASFWPLLEVLRERGATFVPASRRQYATVTRSFADAPGDIAYVAENGDLVAHRGEVVSKTTVDAALVARMVAATRRSEADVGLVLCGVKSAYVERRDPSFVRETKKYYARLEVADDLTHVQDETLKLAVYVFGPAEPLARTTFAPLAEGYQLVVSGAKWKDIMDRDVNKGRAVRELQAALGVLAERTVVFAKYLNDLEMLDAVR